MELAPTDTTNTPAAAVRQDAAKKTKQDPIRSGKDTREKKAAHSPVDSVTLTTSEDVARPRFDREKPPSHPVTREEMVALFESFSEKYRFTVKA